MKRASVIVGNWKMFKTTQEAKAFLAVLQRHSMKPGRRVFLSVPFTCMEALSSLAKGVAIGAQNMHDHREGAFTGEISAPMLKASGAQFVLLGHSERRQYFAETNPFIHRKLQRALQEGLLPILCIGELLSHRESGSHEEILKLQLEECLGDLSSEDVKKLMIAYEPVWAIGTGKTATPEMAQEVHLFIRSWLSSRFGKECAKEVHLLYGGSVKKENSAALLGQPDIDGVLVGGASLAVEEFVQIIND